MKKLLVGAAVFAAMTGTAQMAQAQALESGGVRFGVSGGLTVPVGSLGDAYGSGFNINGHASVKPSSFPVTLRGDVSFWTLGGKTISGGGGVGTFKSDSRNLFSVNGNAIYNFEGAKDATFVPYIIGGGGIYSGSEGFGTKIGLNAGGGVTFRLGGFDAFTEARFHNIFGDGGSARVIPISFGVMFKP